MTTRKKPNFIPAQMQYRLCKELESRSEAEAFRSWPDACSWAAKLVGQPVTKKNLEHCIFSIGKKCTQIVKVKRDSGKAISINKVREALYEIYEPKREGTDGNVLRRKLIQAFREIDHLKDKIIVENQLHSKVGEALKEIEKLRREVFQLQRTLAPWISVEGYVVHPHNILGEMKHIQKQPERDQNKNSEQ